MKTTTVIILIVVLFLGYCVKLAYDNREAKKVPAVSAGVNYQVVKDKYEAGVGRYEIGVELNKEANESDVKAISEWIQSNREESDVFIIFFYVPGQSGAWARVDLPNYKFEVMPKLEY